MVKFRSVYNSQTGQLWSHVRAVALAEAASSAIEDFKRRPPCSHVAHSFVDFRLHAGLEDCLKGNLVKAPPPTAGAND